MVIATAICPALLPAGDAVWTAVPNTGVAASDVDNEGRAVFGFTFYGSSGSSIEVNGVTFAKAAVGGNFGPSFSFSPNLTGGATVYYSGTDVETPYLYLLSNAFYGSGSAMTVQFKNLDVGKTYRAQLFFTDTRNPSRWVRIGDQQVNYAGDGFEKGGRLVGEFTATGETYQVELEYSSGAQQLNAVCLRQVSRHLNDVQWSLKKTTGAESDVDLRGELVLARAACQTTLNGVPFEAVTSPGGVVSWGAGVEVKVANSGKLTLNTSAFNPPAEDPLPEGYRALLKGATYVDNAGALWLKLTNLTPGRRYLVQLWTSDSRSNGDSRSQSVDNAVTLRFRSGTELPYGNNAVGIFTASGTEQVLSLREEKGTCLQLNALQLREIGAVSARADAWTGEALTGNAATDIRADGDGVFAYMCCWRAEAVTMNGVSYSGKNTSQMTSDISFEPGYPNVMSGFCPSGVELNDDYHKFLDWAAYGSSTPVDVIFKNLQPGFRYLAQMVFADLRDSTSGRFASVGAAKAYYNGKGETGFPYGGTLVGELTTLSTAKTVQVSYSAANAQHLSTIQLRCLGFDGLTRTAAAGTEWSVSGSGWTLGSEPMDGQTLWDEANGSTNAAGFAADAALTLTSDVWVDVISSKGALTIGGADRALTVGYCIFAPEVTINAKWGSRYLTKIGFGRLTLAGGCPELEEALVTDGTVVFASDSAKSVALELGASGVVEVADGRAVKVSSLTGAGTVKGPGRVDFTSGEAVAIPPGIVRDGIVWGLMDGTTLEYADGADLSNEKIYIDDPEAAEKEGRVVVHVNGSATGTPKFLFPQKRCRAVWNAALSGWQIQTNVGLILIFR